MRLVNSLILIGILSLKDFNCEAKRRRNPKTYLRKSRSKSFPVLTTPHTGQNVRIIHGVSDDITSGTVQVFVRNDFGIVCYSGWDLNDADVFCKQMGFTGGASTTTYGQYDRGSQSKFVLDNVSCDRNSKTLHECDWSNPGHCDPAQIAGVMCKKNIGCPDGWIAGPTGCYQVSLGKVTKKDFAINRCLSKGGYLATIETDEENHFISNALWDFSNGPILIGGIRKDDGWTWQKVTNDSTDGRIVTYTPIENFHWFPGWQPGNILIQPEDKKKQQCVYLSNNFHTPNGTAINVGYHFWLNERCSSTRKTMPSGFYYMCERPLETTEDAKECLTTERGTQYRGTTSLTSKGTPCIKWSKSTDINPVTYPNTGLGDHNYCRNPDNDESPWCFVSDGEFEFCDIPKCSDNAGDNTTIECKEDEFKCSDNKCIPSLWTCDLEHDCVNGEDEQQNCAYKIELFKVSEGLSVSGHVVETYNGATNETCAKYCFDSTNFVCKSFSFNPETRECKLSDQNTENIDFRSSRRENIFELISQLVGCYGMFKCDNGRCSSYDDVCDGQDQCGDFSDEQNCEGEDIVSVRLAGDSETEGRVEVFYKGEWGVVCDDEWDMNDAKVVCRMLGYMGNAVAVLRSRHGRGGKNFLLDEVECRGDEESIAQCEHSGWKQHDCYSWEVAAVQCSEETREEEQEEGCKEMEEFTCTIDKTCIFLEEVCDNVCQCTNCTDEQQCEPKVELVGGRDNYEGRVEITINGVNGTICDDDFDDVDADVVCRMLGFSSGVTASVGMFGPGNGAIWMDEVSCIGNEADITQCSYLGPRDHTCTHDEDVGVICMTDDIIGVTLVGGQSKNSGRVILTRNGENGTICDDDWDNKDAHVICRMLGMSGGIALDGEFYGAGDKYLPIFLDNVECTGDEESIDQCSHNDWLVHNCDHTEDAAVKCTSLDIETTTETTTTTTVSMTTSLAADTTTSQEPVPSTKREDCWDDRNKPYVGGIAITENGFECQRWTLNSPHQHKHHNDSAYPDGSVVAAKNYCRAPDGDLQPWCYTTHPDERWGYCHIPKCKKNCFSIASKYNGTISTTASGHTCQKWSLNTPQKHKYSTRDDLFPDGSVEAAGNNCRAPDDDVTPWCYTTDSNVRWEYCNISKCSGKFDFDAPCGQRPLEISRSRRNADDSSYDNDDDSKDIDELEILPYRKLARIYGGSRASYGMYPWQAGIRRRMSGLLSYHRHHCGGTIIGEYWVLSAAHCYRDMSKKQIVVRAGDLNSENRDKYEQEFDVEAVFIHPRYVNLGFDNDIALLKLKPVRGHGIVFNDYVQPACLPNITTEYVPRRECLISGWGEMEGEVRSKYLRAARVPLVDQRTCSRLHKHSITPNMVCAGYLAGGTDTCAGDSGGPLVCKINSKYTVMGVVSFGEGCAMPNSPGVYARVTSFIPWIRTILVVGCLLLCFEHIITND
ncbi:Neurotrypsin [Mactra antiquata]